MPEYGDRRRDEQRLDRLIVVRFDAAQAAAVRERAEDSDRTVSDVVRQAVERELARVTERHAVVQD